MKKNLHKGYRWLFERPYEHPYWGHCQWVPWLPRGGWTGLYAPYAIPEEQEIATLEGQSKMLEQALENIKRRLKELKKVNDSH